MEKLVPKNHGEELAVFRSQVIGPLALQVLTRGMLHKALVELSKLTFRPPGSEVTRTFSVPTLQRWYYGFRKGKLAALEPKRRKDRGHAKALAAVTRDLVLAIRRENPSASAKLIVRTLEENGRLGKNLVSASTVRRFLKEAGLDRTSLRANTGSTRLRWEASHPGALWQGDVCHGPVIGGDGRWLRPRIHALMDDKSRFVVSLEARATECEDDMLALFVATVRRWGRPDALYLDNGSTYIGAALATACARLGVSLIHPPPYDPEARGKPVPISLPNPAARSSRGSDSTGSLLVPGHRGHQFRRTADTDSGPSRTPSAGRILAMHGVKMTALPSQTQRVPPDSNSRIAPREPPLGGDFDKSPTATRWRSPVSAIRRNRCPRSSGLDVRGAGTGDHTPMSAVGWTGRPRSSDPTGSSLHSMKSLDELAAEAESGAAILETPRTCGDVSSSWAGAFDSRVSMRFARSIRRRRHDRGQSPGSEDPAERRHRWRCRPAVPHPA